MRTSPASSRIELGAAISEAYRKTWLFDWAPERRAAVAMCRQARPAPDSECLSCDQDGACCAADEPDEAPGWKSMWQRLMARMPARTQAEVLFNAHRPRAKTDPDAENLERARRPRRRTDAATTARAYRRKPDRIA